MEDQWTLQTTEIEISGRIIDPWVRLGDIINNESLHYSQISLNVESLFI